MSIRIIIRDTTSILLRYEEELGRGAEWLDDKLKSDDEHTFRRTFTITSKDNAPIDDGEDPDTVRYFKIGELSGEHNLFYRKVLGTKHDVLLHTSVRLEISTFVATKDISIFRKIDDLVDEQIVVGGSRDGSIPVQEFMRLLREFPTSTELWRYADVRISNIVGDYLETMDDAALRLSNYFDKKHRSVGGDATQHNAPKPTKLARELDLEKYELVLGGLKTMLDGQLGYSEKRWQEEIKDLLLLIYPQYIVAIRELPVKDWYSKQFKMTKRYPDFTLLNYAGNIDIIEIKKPSTPVLRMGRYRDNYIPAKDLSGTIMQAEKYIFYLNKGARELEAYIQNKYQNIIPAQMEIKIVSPKAMVLLGRDNEMTKPQLLDLEIIKRKYSNVIDILTYDDLLRRLQNAITVLKKV